MNTVIAQQDIKYNSVVKKYRNFLRKFSYISVVRRISDFLFSAKLDVENPNFPWVAERFLVWTLSDSKNSYKDKILDEMVLLELVRHCFSEMDLIYELIDINKTDINLYVRQNIVSQFEYQRSFDLFSFGRQIFILNEQPENSKIKSQLNLAIGYDAINYLKNCYFILAVSEYEVSFNKAVENFMQHYGKENLNQFLGYFSVPIELVENCMKNKKLPTFDQWHRPNLLSDFPCLKIGDSYVLTGKTALRRYCEHFIDDWMDNISDSNLRKKWEDSLCNYTMRILKKSNVDVLDEEQIRAVYSVQGKVCDLCVITESFVILIEVKRKNFSSVMPVMASERDFKSRLKATVVKAIEQLGNVYSYVNNSNSLVNKK